MSADHFAAEDWVDFARGVAAPPRDSAMRQHLHSGCRECTDLHDTWRDLAAMAAADDAYEPPASALHILRAVYSTRRPAGSALSRAVDRVKVLFDSQFVAAPIGVRSGVSARRKVLFATGDLMIDVQLEPLSRTNRTVILGQITAPKNIPQPPRHVDVVVLRETSVVARATTNDLGEFQVEFDGGADDISIALGSNDHGTVLTLGNLRRT